jgi:hypothetical protein
MANQTFNLGYEREWERRRNLQRAVLLPLIERLYKMGQPAQPHPG